MGLDRLLRSIAMRLFLALLCVVLAAADAYQVMTGNRRTTKPSKRTVRRMRIESAIASVVLTVIGILALIR